MNLLIAGDYCPCNRVANAFERDDFTSVLSDVRRLTSDVDYSIVNLECPVVTSRTKPIEKHGPCINCSPKGVDALKYAGFDCVTLANNHFRDYGDVGVRDTIETLELNGIEHVGGGMNSYEAARVLYKEIGGQRLAVINCCENEFSIATENTGGSNPLNPFYQYRVISEARRKADYVLLIVHGGHELFQLPSPRMVDTYRFFIDIGADAVVNHHQHCFSGYEIYNGKPIFYGLGNFCFDDQVYRDGAWTEGYAITLVFSSGKTSFELHPYHQCAESPEVVLLPNDAFNDRISRLNTIISDSIQLKASVEEYYSRCPSVYSSIFEPFFNRFSIMARVRGWLPSLINKKRKLAAKDFVCCEAHRDRLIWWLNH